MQMETLRLDELEEVKVWLPDLHIYELREDEELLTSGMSGLERAGKESAVSLSSAGADQVAGSIKCEEFFFKDCDRKARKSRKNVELTFQVWFNFSFSP